MVTVEDWGLVYYSESLERQRQCVEERIVGVRGDTLIFVEHPAVYTIGARPEAEKHLTASKEFLEKNKIDVVQTNRGGDITLHSPGQLVIYPIIKLEKKDLHEYLRKLEQTIINAVGALGLATGRNEGKTGVWVMGGPGREAPMKKLAAIGVAVRQWVTYHGAALNVTNDLSLYQGIVPCGLSEPVTSLQAELKENCPTLEQVKESLERAWQQRQP